MTRTQQTAPAHGQQQAHHLHGDNHLLVGEGWQMFTKLLFKYPNILDHLPTELDQLPAYLDHPAAEHDLLAAELGHVVSIDLNQNKII